MLPRILYSRWFIAALIILVALAGRAAFKVYGRYQDSRATLALAEKELAIMEDKKTALQKEIAKLKTEEGIEKEIRKKYQVTKDSEQLIVILDAQPKNRAETPKKPDGLWQTIIKFFSL